MDTDLLSDIKLVPSPPFNGDIARRLKTFAADLVRRGEKSYATFTVPVRAVDPLAFLQTNWSDQAFQYYWEKPSGDFALAASGVVTLLSASGQGRFADIQRQQQAVTEAAASFSCTPHACSGLMFLGGFSFFSELESPEWDSFEAASLTVPKWLVMKDGDHFSATVTVDARPFHEPENLYDEMIGQLRLLDRAINSTPERYAPVPVPRETTGASAEAQLRSGYDSWISSVEKARDQIRRKTYKKIVLSRRLSVSGSGFGEPAALLDRLRAQYRNCSCFLIHPPGGNSFLGATPEQLVSFQHDFLRTEALAGSMERGKTTTEDIGLERNLSFSAKNRDEHRFVVRDIEQRLRPFARAIYRRSRPRVKKFSNVQHLHTPIQADLKPEATVLSILEQLHPTPAVGGYPREKAAPHIHQLEDFERGWYAGPVGWLNASGNGEFAVAIRSGLLGREKAHFFAGCGIVASSDPQAEWEETNLKLMPMLSALRYD